MSGCRVFIRQKHRGAVLITSFLTAALVFTLTTAIIRVADEMTQELNWQTVTLRGENTAAQAVAACESWLRKEISSGHMFAAQDFEAGAIPAAQAAKKVPDAVLAGLRQTTPYASVSAEIVDLNYPDGYREKAAANMTPRAAPLKTVVQSETGENTDYRVKYIQLIAAAVMPSERNAVFSRTETFLVLLSADGSFRVIRLYSKKS